MGAPHAAELFSRRGERLFRSVALRMGLPRDQVDTVVLGAIFSEIENLTALKKLAQEMTQGEGPGTRFPLAWALLEAFPAPYHIDELLRALEHRLGGGGPIGAHTGAEIVYTVRTIVRRRQAGQMDVAAILGDNVHHHSPIVVNAMAAVLRWESLHAEASPRYSGNEVLLALRDPALLTALELQLTRAGFHIVLVASGREAIRTAANRKPVCLLSDLELPGLSGTLLLTGLRENVATREIPVLFVADSKSGPTASRVLEQGAEDVLTRPVSVDLLVAKVRRLAQRAAKAPERGIRGQLADLPLPDLLQTLTLGGRTGIVRIFSDKGTGGLGVVKGQLTYARFEDERGERALKALVALQDGRFVVEFGKGLTKRNLSGSTEWLLLEALRKRDEALGVSQF